MTRWINLVRGVMHDDRAAAFEAEQAQLAQATHVPAVDPRLRSEMTGGARDPRVLLLGNACHDASVPIGVPLHEVAGEGHALVLGGTNSGKTYECANVVTDVAARFARDPAEIGLVVEDHKGDLVALARAGLAALVTRLPRREAERLLNNVVVINPFSTEALVPLQVLAPEPGVAPEVQAFEVTSLVNRLGGAELGVLQDSFTFHLLLLGIVARPEPRSLPELAELLADPAALTSEAARSPSPAVRGYFAGTTPIATASLQGVRARFDRLLRLPSARLMLGARRSVSFHELMATKILLIDVGSPPLGCEDLGRFWSGLLTLRLTRAIFERTLDEARRPVAVFVDEWQEGLAAGGDIASHYERVLGMARSRGVSLWLISQSLARAAQVSAALPKVVATNTNLQFIFRASPEDGQALSRILPVTGRRARPPALPWEERSRTPYLTRNEEREILLEEVSVLPQRTFYLWNRNRPYPATLVRARDFDPRVVGHRDLRVEERLKHGALAVPIAELEAEEQRREEAVFRPVPRPPTEPDRTERSLRPRRR